MNAKNKGKIISAIAVGNVAAIERATKEGQSTIELWRIQGGIYTEASTGRALTEHQFSRYAEEKEAAPGYTLLLLTGDISKYTSHTEI